MTKSLLDELEPGWLFRQMDKCVSQVQTWPEWMRDIEARIRYDEQWRKQHGNNYFPTRY